MERRFYAGAKDIPAPHTPAIRQCIPTTSRTPCAVPPRATRCAPSPSQPRSLVGTRQYDERAANEKTRARAFVLFWLQLTRGFGRPCKWAGRDRCSGNRVVVLRKRDRETRVSVVPSNPAHRGVAANRTDAGSRMRAKEEK